ncbi:tripartite tricarboxylate transporter permease [Pikeienuella sp. HZG-20]|uniref:tripartite tricarboxylate transporter permease n=1 Tax=Paludibacillus litoralis TaxID=3133267 RepID=UPI0030EEAEB0
MESLAYLSDGFAATLAPRIVLVMLAAIVGGIVIGTLPGLTSVMAISLMLPIAYSLDPVTGLAMLGAIYSAAIYGGANSAILLNTPGTPSSLATTFDGYPMTLQGRADDALYASLIASVVGGLVGTVILIASFGPLARISLAFGPPEYFWLAILGLLTIAAMSSGNMVKGVFSGALGMLLATIGLDPSIGLPRFTFGYSPLIEGIGMVPALLGIFSFSQALKLLEDRSSYIVEYKPRRRVIRSLIPVFVKRWWLILRSSLIGTGVGVLPGAGGVIASLIAYNEARRWDRDPSRYGKGAIEGLIASESANNAQVSGSLVPMMGLGIPGSANAAIILGALLAFGIQPGVGLLRDSGDVAYAFMASLIVANVLMLFVGAVMIRATVRVLLVPSSFISPTIIVFCVIGAYAASYGLYSVVVMAGAGFLAYLLSKADIPLGPMGLGLVLGPIAEQGFGLSLMIGRSADNLLDVFVFRPISIVLILLCAATVVTAFILERREKMKTAMGAG